MSEKQFPDIFEILKDFSAKLELKNIPDLYIIQGNGILNAFATRFAGRNTIVLYSNILEAAYQEGFPAIQFIIGHELGHIVRKHVSFPHQILLFPARFIPFLSNAYSRACEHTCDNIGNTLCPEGAEKGLLILAAGKLAHKINTNEIIKDDEINNNSFSVSFAQCLSTHPALTKRIACLNEINKVKSVYSESRTYQN